MQDSGKGPLEAIQLVKNRGAADVSARKITANRQNALKSTGPKTPRGKAFSRRNALKHGLFARHFMDFGVHKEDPGQYEELLNGLRADYRPAGTAEKLEVEYIANCWWKRKRLWRYENAVNRVALRTLGSKELEEKAEICKTQDEEEKAVILLLQSAMKEIEVTGELSRKLKQKMFVTMPRLEVLWPTVEELAQETLNFNLSKISRELNAKERASLALCTASIGVKCLEGQKQLREASVTEIAIAQHIIPNSEALDKILRYEAANNRSLNRAVDQLERLQRRRRGEPVLPLVSVRLTQ